MLLVGGAKVYHMSTCSFSRELDRTVASPTLIEGLPGHGLVASIVVDQIRKELGMDLYGGIRSPEVPPLLSFSDGYVKDTVRVYSSINPNVLTLHGDVMFPSSAYRPFSQCVLDDLADEIEKGVFLVAAPAEDEHQHGELFGVATNEAIGEELLTAGIKLANGDGIVGGVTGALVDECYQASVPAALILVRADPYVPDPEAARIVIEEALEPLLSFDIDTAELEEQATKIKAQKAQIADQYREMQEQQPPQERSPVPGMFQ